MTNKQKFQDIFTPKCMVDELLEYVDIKDGDKILEPSAGDGNMVIPIMTYCASHKIKDVHITAIEIQKNHCEKLQERVNKFYNVLNGKKPKEIKEKKIKTGKVIKQLNKEDKKRFETNGMMGLLWD